MKPIERMVYRRRGAGYWLLPIAVALIANIALLGRGAGPKSRGGRLGSVRMRSWR